MAKETRKKPSNSTQTVNAPQTGEQETRISQEMVLRSNNRSKKDVGTWRNGIISAESVYNPNWVPLLDMHTDILLDAHLAGLIKKRVASVINKKLVFKVGEKKVDEMDKLIESKVFSDLRRQFIMTKMHGRTAMEFVPGGPLAFNEVPRKHIDMKNQLITKEQWGGEGVFYPDYWNLWVIGDPNDLGLLTICGFYALLKKGAISNWAEYVELYGSPVMVLKYGGNDLQSRKQAQSIIDKSGNSLKIAITKEMDFQIVDGKTSNGDGSLQETFIERLNQEMSLIITGNTETSTNGKGGTGAKSLVHQNEQKQLTKEDMDYELDMLNSDKFLGILARYGYKVEGGHFEYVGEVDIDFLQQKIKVDLPLMQAGLPVAAKYLYETYNIPMPEPGEQLVILGSAQEPDADETEPDADETPKPKPIGKQPAKPKTRKTAQPAQMAMTPDEIRAMMKTTLSDFFATALSTEG